jgi:hypothetical protein
MRMRLGLALVVVGAVALGACSDSHDAGDDGDDVADESLEDASAPVVKADAGTGTSGRDAGVSGAPGAMDAATQSPNPPGSADGGQKPNPGTMDPDGGRADGGKPDPIKPDGAVPMPKPDGGMQEPKPKPDGGMPPKPEKDKDAGRPEGSLDGG